MGEQRGPEEWVVGPRDADGNIDTSKALIMNRGEADKTNEQRLPVVEASSEMLADLEAASLSETNDPEAQQDVKDHFAGINDQVATLLSEEARPSYDLSQYGDLLANLGGRIGLVKYNERSGYDDLDPSVAVDARRKHGDIKSVFDQVGSRLFPDVRQPSNLEDASASLEQIGLDLSKQDIFASVGVSIPSREELSTMSPEQVAKQLDFVIESLGTSMEYAANIDEDAIREGEIGVNQPVQVVEAAKALFHLGKVRDTYYQEAYGKADLTADQAEEIDRIKSDLGIETGNAVVTGDRWNSPQVNGFNEIIGSVARGDLNDEINRLKRYENPDDPDDEMAAGDARNALELARKYGSILTAIQRASERGEKPTPDQMSVMMRPLEKMAKGSVDDLPAAIEKVENPKLQELLRSLESTVRSLGDK